MTEAGGPVVKKLEAVDKKQDSYMTAFSYINDDYAALVVPEV